MESPLEAHSEAHVGETHWPRPGVPPLEELDGLPSFEWGFGRQPEAHPETHEPRPEVLSLGELRGDLVVFREVLEDQEVYGQSLPMASEQ